MDRLDTHPANSNVMPDEAFAKLVGHIERSNRYPPVIVRPCGDTRYQILDGHHRVKALRELRRPEARCEVWDVDDTEALLLMATLNRLQGRDDPRKRAALLDALSSRFDAGELTARLPEGSEKLKRLLELHASPPPMRTPRKLEDMPVAVHFFLKPAEKRRLVKALRATADTHEAALMAWVERTEADQLAVGGGDAS